jgi:hypothetical protein
MLGRFIRACEDSLTAAVFTHLLHLPAEVFWRILRRACCTDTLPESAGEPLSVDYWPSWDPKGTGNTNRVVPDFFIRFRGFDLIIEAKRWDSDMQNPLAFDLNLGEQAKLARIYPVFNLVQRERSFGPTTPTYHVLNWSGRICYCAFWTLVRCGAGRIGLRRSFCARQGQSGGFRQVKPG